VLAESEIRQVRVVGAIVSLAEQDVARLDVAVYQAVRVRGVERGSCLSGDGSGASRAEAAFRLDQGADVPVTDVAHRDEQHAVGLTCLEYRNDVGVLDAGGSARLADEALPEGLVLAEVRSQHLERDGTTEPQVQCAVDHGHAAAADLFLDLVAG
jgi:hypothetical protein